MTNLLCSIIVALVTNVTERVPTHQEYVQPKFGQPYTLEFMGYCDVPDANPDRKWTRTQITRVTTLKFNWLGKERTITEEEPVSDIEVEYRVKRNEIWTVARTNDIQRQTTVTNYTILWMSNKWAVMSNGIIISNGIVISSDDGTITNKP